MPLTVHSNGNATVPYMLNTTYEPSQPNRVPSITPTTPDTSEMSNASTPSERLSWPRVMPMARRVADSRVRSITDSDSVLATPTSAMSTATAIRPTMSIIMESIVFPHCARSAIGPDTVASVLFESADWRLSNTPLSVVPVSLIFTSNVCEFVSRSPFVKWLPSTNPTAPYPLEMRR